jgi:hypothetical protein
MKGGEFEIRALAVGGTWRISIPDFRKEVPFDGEEFWLVDLKEGEYYKPREGNWDIWDSCACFSFAESDGGMLVPWCVYFKPTESESHSVSGGDESRRESPAEMTDEALVERTGEESKKGAAKAMPDKKSRFELMWEKGGEERKACLIFVVPRKEIFDRFDAVSNGTAEEKTEGGTYYVMLVDPRHFMEGCLYAEPPRAWPVPVRKMRQTAPPRCHHKIDLACGDYKSGNRRGSRERFREADIDRKITPKMNDFVPCSSDFCSDDSEEEEDD